MVTARVVVNTQALDRLKRSVGSVSRSQGHPAWTDMRRQWGVVMEAFTRRRFDRYSKGGGDWPPLALRTVNARRRAGTTSAFGGNKIVRKGGKDGIKNKAGFRLVAQARARDTTRGGGIVGTTRRAAILVNTGTLKAALQLGFNGNEFRPIPGGVRYGIQGGVSRTVRKVSTAAGGKKRRRRLSASLAGKPTVGQIAKWHQTGAGRLPRRTIVVPPDAETRKRLERSLSSAVTRIIRESGAGRKR